MTVLYNCRQIGNQYRITKFDRDMNVESSYLCARQPAACECPAFEKRQRCRHMEMLPKFIARGHIGDEWFLDFDRGGWVQMGQEWAAGEARSEPEPEPEPVEVMPGVVMVPMGNPETVFNAIADAVGEPRAAERPKAAFIRRRL